MILEFSVLTRAAAILRSVSWSSLARYDFDAIHSLQSGHLIDLLWKWSWAAASAAIWVFLLMLWLDWYYILQKSFFHTATCSKLLLSHTLSFRLIVDVLIIDRVVIDLIICQYLAVAWHPESRFSQARYTIILQRCPMEEFVRIIFRLFEPIVPLLLLFLFFGHLLWSLTLSYFFSCKGSFDETQNVLRDELLHVEGQVLFDEIISGAYDTEIVISSKSDRLELFEDILLYLIKLLLINFQALELVDWLLIFTVLFVVFFCKSLHFTDDSIEIADFCLA